MIMYIKKTVFENKNEGRLFEAICKPRHWNLGIGIGIGIGIDVTNTITSSSRRPMDPNLSRVVT